MEEGSCKLRSIDPKFPQRLSLRGLIFFSPFPISSFRFRPQSALGLANRNFEDIVNLKKGRDALLILAVISFDLYIMEVTVKAHCVVTDPQNAPPRIFIIHEAHTTIANPVTVAKPLHHRVDKT